MSKLAITLLIGLAAATIDVLPMVLRKTEWTTIASAFTHWVVTTILISYAVMPMAYSQSKSASVLPILGISIVLGAAVGLMTARFAG
jgi:hypothetical protein